MRITPMDFVMYWQRERKENPFLYSIWHNNKEWVYDTYEEIIIECVQMGMY